MTCPQLDGGHAPTASIYLSQYHTVTVSVNLSLYVSLCLCRCLCRCLCMCLSLSAGSNSHLRLVEQRLAACVNAVPSVQSTYLWEGKVLFSLSICIRTHSHTSSYFVLRCAQQCHLYRCLCLLSVPLFVYLSRTFDTVGSQSTACFCLSSYLSYYTLALNLRLFYLLVRWPSLTCTRLKRARRCC